MKIHTNIKCNTCGLNNFATDRKQSFLRLYRNLEKTPRRLVDMFTTSNNQVCQRCGDFNRTENLLIENHEHTRYLVLFIPQFTMAKKNCQEIRMTNRIHVEDTENIIIKSINNQNISYRIKSAIFHEGESTKNGHYEAWTKNEKRNEWFKISDSNVRKFRELTSLDQAYLIFLEKN